METLRFLMVTTFYPPLHLGGDAVHVQYLAKALAAQGHEVHVEYSPAAYSLKRKGMPRSPPREDDGVHLHPIPGESWRQPVAAHVLGRSASVSRFHSLLLRDVEPDVIHHHNISLLGLGVLGRREGSRSLYTAHDYWIRCPRSDLLKYGKYECDGPTCVRCSILSARPPQLWRYGRRWRGLTGIDCVIAPSRFMALAIESSVECPVVHIPNFAPDSDANGSAQHRGGYFLFVGVLEAHKGVSELVAASQRRPFPLRVVGQGSLRNQLVMLANGGEAGIRVEGWVSRDRLLQLYRDAEALVIPSLWPENAPLVAVEALSCGTPLLVSRRGGLEELLHDGSTGLSFEPHAEGISEAVTELQDREDSPDLRVAARKAYERYHSPDSYLGAYLEVAKGDSPPTSHESTSPTGIETMGGG